MPLILGAAHEKDADFLDACRKKRNIAEYDAVGKVSEKEAGELIDYARELREAVVTWLERCHPELSPWSSN